MNEQPTPMQLAFRAAMHDAIAAIEQLRRDGREDRAAGLAVAVDIGTSAAFLWSVDERAYQNAINVIREAIEHAQRDEP